MNRFAAAILVASTLALVPGAAQAAGLGERPLSAGAHGTDVTALQRALVKLGYRLTIDGQYGGQTTRAVRRYERENGMAVDGRVSRRDARSIARAARATRVASGGLSPEAAAQQTAAPSTPAAPVAATHVFPVAGSYSLGTAANRFGAPRSGHDHEGQDILAAEGTPLVAVTAGTVHWRAYQAGGAGHYIVVRGDDGFDYVYMHLRETALPVVGDRVAAGARLGYVGHTGAAQGSHLHFELWKGAWRNGGHPVDPLPYLTRWAA